MSSSAHVIGHGPRVIGGHVRAWDEPIAAYLTWLRASGAQPGTVRLREHHLRMFAGQGTTGPWERTPADLAAFVGRNGWAPETRKSARSVLRTFYGWSMDTSRTTIDPSRTLRPVRVPAAIPRPAPEHAVTTSIAAAAPRDALMIALAAYAGLRCMEIAGLRVADVTASEIIVRGKGGHQRAIPLHPALSERLEAAIERGVAGAVYVFPGLRAGEHMRANSVSWVLSQVLPPGWSAHSLRHAFASRAYAGTRDLRAVQTLLGHSKPETTARYTAVPDGALAAAVAAAGPRPLRAG